MKMNAQEIYMNAQTGSVDTKENWIAEGVNLADLVLVVKDENGNHTEA